MLGLGKNIYACEENSPGTDATDDCFGEYFNDDQFTGVCPPQREVCRNAMFCTSDCFTELVNYYACDLERTFGVKCNYDCTNSAAAAPGLGWVAIASALLGVVAPLLSLG